MPRLPITPGSDAWRRTQQSVNRLTSKVDGLLADGPVTGYVDSAVWQTILPSSSPDQFALRYYRRNANHTGGTVGYTSSGLRVDSYVSSGVTNYEWAGLFLLDNSAAAGENVASYSKAIKRSTGPTWAGTLEAVDATGSANPSTGLVGAEIDIRANGTDNNNVRVGCDVVITRQLSSGSPTGAAMEAGWGFRVQTGGDASAVVKVGYGFYNGTTVVTGFDTSIANITGDAFKMATGQFFAFDATSQHRLRYQSSVGITYAVAGTDTHSLRQDGTIWSKPLTFATLPTAGLAGRRAFITDCNTATFNAAAAGGGTNKVPVFDNGASWMVG